MFNAHKFRDMFIQMELMEAVSDYIEKEWDKDLTNEALEEAWDKAYADYRNAWWEVVNYLTRELPIDMDTAKAMVATKREEIFSLCERLK